MSASRQINERNRRATAAREREAREKARKGPDYQSPPEHLVRRLMARFRRDS